MPNTLIAMEGIKPIIYIFEAPEQFVPETTNHIKNLVRSQMMLRECEDLLNSFQLSRAGIDFTSFMGVQDGGTIARGPGYHLTLTQQPETGICYATEDPLTAFGPSLLQAFISKSITYAFTTSAAKGGMTELQSVTKAAQKAEAAIGGSGGVAGTLKHTYAKNLLSRYQSMYGGNLSLGSNYFNGPAGRGFLDAVNHSTKTIYDFKFGNAFMSNSQFLKYSNSFPGYGIQIIKP